MKRGSVLLTMGMAVYNEEKYISEAIESLLSQTFKDFILIISDNASTDRTPEICKHYAKKDKRIVFVRHTQNKGGFFSFNYVLDRANTPFFMLCGGHDKWDPQFVEKLLPLIQKENLVLVYPQSREIKIDETLGKVFQDNYTTTKIEKPANRYLYILRNIGKCNIIHGIWRTEVLKNCYFKPVIGSDVLILLSAALLGKFKQYNPSLFFRRIVREEKNKHLRQFYAITGKCSQKPPSIFFLRFGFIFENVKMIYQVNSQLGTIPKLILSMQTIYMWIKKFYIKPFFKLFKKILPDRIYFSLKNKIKRHP